MALEMTFASALPHAGGVDVDHWDAVIQVAREVHLGRLRLGLERSQDVMDQRSRVDWFSVEHEAAGIGQHERSQVLDKHLEAAGRVEDAARGVAGRPDTGRQRFPQPGRE